MRFVLGENYSSKTIPTVVLQHWLFIRHPRILGMIVSQNINKHFKNVLMILYRENNSYVTRSDLRDSHDIGLKFILYIFIDI